MELGRGVSGSFGWLRWPMKALGESLLLYATAPSQSKGIPFATGVSIGRVIPVPAGKDRSLRSLG